MRLRDSMPMFPEGVTWLNGKNVKKGNIVKRKPTLIHFWSVSCSSCKQTMSQVNKIWVNNQDNLQVIAVHMPRSKNDRDLNQIETIAKKYKMTQPIIIDNEYEITDAFNNKYVPAYYVFDKEGKLRHYQAGKGGMQLLQKRINRVLLQ